MSRPTIELAIYCRDEESCVEQAIRSAIDHVDGFYCWDTGSSDSTLDIIRTYTQRIYTLAVPEDVMDFGMVETMLLHLAKADFVFRLDADETVEHAHLLRDLVEEDYDVWKFARYRWADLAKTVQLEKEAFPDHQMRLIKNDGASWFRDVLHPHFESPHVIGTADGVWINHFVDVFHLNDPEKLDKRNRLYKKLAEKAGKAPEGSRSAMKLAGHD